MSAITMEPRKIIANEAQSSQARDVTRQLPSHGAAWTTRSESDVSVALPDELSRLVTTIIRTVAEGGTVTVSSMPPEITTTTAAEILGISRPTLMKLVRSGELASHKVGSHTRLKSEDVFELKRSRMAERRRALEELMALEDAEDYSS